MFIPEVDLSPTYCATPGTSIETRDTQKIQTHRQILMTVSTRKKEMRALVWITNKGISLSVVVTFFRLRNLSIWIKIKTAANEKGSVKTLNN